MKWLLGIWGFFFFPVGLKSQTTTGSISGKVSFNNKAVTGAALILIDEGTNQQITTISNRNGAYGFYQLKPANHYKLTAIYPYADTMQINYITVILGEDVLINIPLQAATNYLKPVLVNSSINTNNANNSINLLNNLPIRGNGLSGLMMHQPHAYIKNDQTGAVSFSSQNYRFNSFYIDGVLQNDLFGLSPTGTIMGETGILVAAPESFEQMQLLVSPYDASLGSFTGAAINMTTRSGKNKPTQEIYTTNRSNAHQYWHSGVNISGPIATNKSFYFINLDQVNETITRPFNTNEYIGETNRIEKLKRFRQSMQDRHGYDIGSFDQTEKNSSQKMAIRIDVLVNKKNQLTINAKWANGFRSSNQLSSANILQFSNNGKIQLHQYYSASIEWKKNINAFTQNKLLFSLNHHQSNTQPRLQAFPSIRILDGEGMLMLGAGEETFQNQLTQFNLNVSNRWSRLRGKNWIEWGIDIDYSVLNNHFIPNGHGQFFYYSISNFLQNRNAVDFSINQVSNTKSKIESLAQLKVIKAALFFNYHTTLFKNTHLYAGIRLNAEKFLNDVEEDIFTQDTALPVLQQFHELWSAQSGRLPLLTSIPSPRVYIKTYLPFLRTSIKIGTGIFSGRIPYAWLSGILSNNGNKLLHHFANNQQLRGFVFNTRNNSGQTELPATFSTNKGTVYVGAAKINMPTIWRTTLDIETNLNPFNKIGMNGMYYQNLSEIGFANINLNPLQKQLEGFDRRWIQSPEHPLNIPLLPDGSNPYNEIVLIKNMGNQNGYGYSAGIYWVWQQKQYRWLMNYSYSNAFSIYDGNFSIPLNHWKLNEQVNGRNNPVMAISDFSRGHQVYAEFQVHIKSFKQKQLNCSIHYTGQSGSPFSYVYDGKNLSGDAPFTSGYDLIYIPYPNEIKEMNFVPLIKKDQYYTIDQQKEALAYFIANDSYLQKRRGQYAQRNGSRSPFNHRFDIKVHYQFPIKITTKLIRCSVALTLLNAANLFNKNWGEQLLVPGNRKRLISFEGFVNNQSLIPIYTFDPALIHRPLFELNNSFNAARSSNWMLQLGCRLSFY
jgi:hypothetical protein